MPLFEAVRLAERYDLAIMSTKGMSVTASRELVDALCAQHAIPLLVLHDFDKAGFSIAGTLRRSTRRYRFGHRHAANVIDLGLRLDDVSGLETEDVYVDSPGKAKRTFGRTGPPKRKSTSSSVEPSASSLTPSRPTNSSNGSSASSPSMASPK